MIDINNIINTAIQQEINKAITNYVDAYMADVQQESRRQIEALRVEIEQLKQQRAVSPATGVDVMQSRPTVDFITDVRTLLTSHADIKQAVYEIAYSAAESVLSDHTEEYDHDEYDRIMRVVDEDMPSEFPDFDDFVTKDELPEFPDVDTLVTKDDMYDAVRNEVRDAVENRVSVSLTLC